MLILECMNNLIEELVTRGIPTPIKPPRRRSRRKPNPFGRGNIKAINYSAQQQKRKIDKMAIVKMSNIKIKKKSQLVRQQNLMKARQSM